MNRPQDDIMHAELDRVSGDVRDCGYDADHFTVAISLPISLALREHSVKEYLRYSLNTVVYSDIGYSDTKSSLLLTVTLMQNPIGFTESSPVANVTTDQ